MQIRKMTLMLTALSVVGMALMGCGDGGRESLTCSTNADCLENEICHPGAKVCVQTCASGNASDCPSSAKVCEALSATDTTKICKCSTSEFCKQDERLSDASGLECSSAYKVCAPTGTTPATCTKDTDCATGQTCQAGVCKEPTTGASCTGTSQSTCAYGEFCSASKCSAAPVAPTTCENFSKNRPEWSVTSSNGPVIYSVEGTGYQVNSSYCKSTAPDAFLVRVKAYRTDANWPDTRAGLSGFFYVNTGAEPFDIVNDGLLLPGTGYNRNTSNFKDAEFNFYLCRPSNSQTIQVGVYFTGGNPVCSQVNR